MSTLRAVDVDDFWTFIELSHRSGPKRADREAYLAHRLSRIPRSDLLDFVQHLSATREPANAHRLWRAADILMEGGCSTDGFHYFQMWLVGLGRTAYERAIADPDSLATVPAVQRLASLPRPWRDDEYPTWESLEYVACQVGDQRADIDGDIRDVVAEERAVTLRTDPNPDDVDWARLTTEMLAVRYPRLWALFSEHWTE